MYKQDTPVDIFETRCLKNVYIFTFFMKIPLKHIMMENVTQYKLICQKLEWQLAEKC